MLEDCCWFLLWVLVLPWCVEKPLSYFRSLMLLSKLVPLLKGGNHLSGRCAKRTTNVSLFSKSGKQSSLRAFQKFSSSFTK